MVLSPNTLGEDDGSVDTGNTADTPITPGRRHSRAREQRTRGDARNPAAAATATVVAEVVSDLETDFPSGSGIVKEAPSRREIAGASPEDSRAMMASPEMSSVQRTQSNVDGNIVSDVAASYRVYVVEILLLERGDGGVCWLGLVWCVCVCVMGGRQDNIAVLG